MNSLLPCPAVCSCARRAAPGPSAAPPACRGGRPVSHSRDSRLTLRQRCSRRCTRAAPSSRWSLQSSRMVSPAALDAQDSPLPGLPLPHSVDLPLACSHILRAQGVTPASIGIVAGRIKVGLTDDEVRFLAQKGFESRTDAQKRETMWKVGRRELPAALVKGCDGGTTVSATMAISQIAGLRFFSTGGIGGVHRGAETSYDISSDLTSLSDTPVVVICAGSKSILDIGLTLEYLETLAVPVGTLGSSAWPAFYTPDSGFKVHRSSLETCADPCAVSHGV